MREILRRLARRIAPTAYEKLEQLGEVDLSAAGNAMVPADLVEQVQELEAQVQELRADNRRVTELYDLVLARLRDDNPLKG